jgi:hypothetical protein
MLTIFYNKNIHVVINGIIFSFDEFKSISKDEKDFLNNNYLEVFYSETQAYSKDENENQRGISEDLLIILNKISSKNESFYLQKRTEFDNPEISLENLKLNKINEFENNYKQSKLKCKISYNDISYSRIEGIDNLIDLCNLWKGYTGGDLIPSINLSISSLQNIFNKTMLLRDNIAKNVEIVKTELNLLISNQDVLNYTTNLKITFDSELKIEELEI